MDLGGIVQGYMFAEAYNTQDGGSSTAPEQNTDQQPILIGGTPVQTIPGKGGLVVPAGLVMDLSETPRTKIENTATYIEEHIETIPDELYDTLFGLVAVPDKTRNSYTRRNRVRAR